jgi:EAL domain-containing protein (putative c-di-GMP-specific phosphodiesterase class I)
MLLTRQELEAHIKTDSAGRYYAVYGGLTLHSVYQPIFANKQQIVGFEALLRIKNSEGQCIRPDLFFSGYTFSSRDQVSVERLSRAIHIRNFACSPMREHKLFLNILPKASEHFLCNKATTSVLMQRLDELSIAPQQIVMELIELDAACDNALYRSIKHLRELGFSIAVDDYGVQASDEKRVRLLEPDILKLDQTLLHRYMLGDGSDIQKALSLGEQLNAQTVIEGIESEDELNQMTDLQVGMFQGYHLARPNPMRVLADQLAGLVTKKGN